jgi:uncharacterized protein YwgA
MAEIKDIIAYFCKKYPHKSELSKARLTKMVYLADWRSCLKRGRQISPIQWIFNHYGPYVEDVANVASTDTRFVVETTTNSYGSAKELVRLKNENVDVKITNAEREIIDHIIQKVSPLYWNSFIELVYSTYPIRKSRRYEELDLVSLAEDYNEHKKDV